MGMAGTRSRATADMDGAPVPLILGAGGGSWCLFFSPAIAASLGLDGSSTGHKCHLHLPPLLGSTKLYYCLLVLNFSELHLQVGYC